MQSDEDESVLHENSPVHDSIESTDMNENSSGSRSNSRSLSAEIRLKNPTVFNPHLHPRNSMDESDTDMSESNSILPLEIASTRPLDQSKAHMIKGLLVDNSPSRSPSSQSGSQWEPSDPSLSTSHASSGSLWENPLLNQTGKTNLPLYGSRSKKRKSQEANTVENGENIKNGETEERNQMDSTMEEESGENDDSNHRMDEREDHLHQERSEHEERHEQTESNHSENSSSDEDENFESGSDDEDEKSLKSRQHMYSMNPPSSIAKHKKFVQKPKNEKTCFDWFQERSGFQLPSSKNVKPADWYPLYKNELRKLEAQETQIQQVARNVEEEYQVLELLKRLSTKIVSNSIGVHRDESTEEVRRKFTLFYATFVLNGGTHSDIGKLVMNRVNYLFSDLNNEQNGQNEKKNQMRYDGITTDMLQNRYHKFKTALDALKMECLHFGIIQLKDSNQNSENIKQGLVQIDTNIDLFFTHKLTLLDLISGKKTYVNTLIPEMAKPKTSDNTQKEIVKKGWTAFAQLLDLILDKINSLNLVRIEGKVYEQITNPNGYWMHAYKPWKSGEIQDIPRWAAEVDTTKKIWGLLYSNGNTWKQIRDVLMYISDERFPEITPLRFWRSVRNGCYDIEHDRFYEVGSLSFNCK